MTELEKAAREHKDELNRYLWSSAQDCTVECAKEAFIAGAEWQSNQSPWISVKERLPEHDNGQSLCEVLIRTSDGRCCVVANADVEVMAKVGEATHWMEIPKV